MDGVNSTQTKELLVLVTDGLCCVAVSVNQISILDSLQQIIQDVSLA